MHPNVNPYFEHPSPPLQACASFHGPLLLSAECLPGGPAVCGVHCMFPAQCRWGRGKACVQCADPAKWTTSDHACVTCPTTVMQWRWRQWNQWLTVMQWVSKMSGKKLKRLGLVVAALQFRLTGYRLESWMEYLTQRPSPIPFWPCPFLAPPLPDPSLSWPHPSMTLPLPEHTPSWTY